MVKNLAENPAKGNPVGAGYPALANSFEKHLASGKKGQILSNHGSKPDSSQNIPQRWSNLVLLKP